MEPGGTLLAFTADAATPLFSGGLYTDSIERVQILGDGTIKISDGATADLTLFRRVVGGKTQLVCDAAGTEVILAAEA